MRKMTVDELMAELQRQKDEGLPGDTVVGIAGRDNNGRRGFANLDVSPSVVTVAGGEFEKNWELVKIVKRGGVPVMLLG